MTDPRLHRPQEVAPWRALREHHGAIQDTHMRDLFARDPGRAGRLSLGCEGILVDYSKHRITDETVSLLLELAQAADLEKHIRALFSGAEINHSERRPALHTALRAPAGSSVRTGGVDVIPAVQGELKRMYGLVRRLNAGKLKGSGGMSIDTIVNIGIGGSDLGPRLAVEALHERATTKLRILFATNIDDQDLFRVLQQCDPRRTLFIVASKSFTTLETLTNAESARDWLSKHGCSDPGRHFAAVTGNPVAARAFGIRKAQTLRIWDWVGGRYSVWSAVGLPLALQIGVPGFREFLAGAHAMDRHFERTPLRTNLPVLLGLLDLWYAEFFAAETRAVIPYDQRLRLLPEYLGQLMMESNGKIVDQGGRPLACRSSPVIWGAVGTNAQHAFFQLLHQGTHLVPVDFLIAARAAYDKRHHRRLLANCLAQSQALMSGRENTEDRQRHFPGNQPSTTIIYDALTPFVLGMLLALYEHRTFVHAMLLGINPFDQWGVELGKQLARELIEELEGGKHAVHDPSTALLLDYYRKSRTNGGDL